MRVAVDGCWRTGCTIPLGFGFTVANATGIDDNGQIVVNGYNAQGYEHAFLLTAS